MDFERCETQYNKKGKPLHFSPLAIKEQIRKRLTQLKSLDNASQVLRQLKEIKAQPPRNHAMIEDELDRIVGPPAYVEEQLQATLSGKADCINVNTSHWPYIKFEV